MKKTSLKQKFKILGIILLTLVCAFILIFLLGVAGKYFKGMGYNAIGNTFSVLTVIITTFGVIVFNKKFNKLSPKDYGLHFRNISRNIFAGLGLPLFIISIVLLTAYLLFDIQPDWIGLNKDYLKPLLKSLILTFLIAAWEEVFFRGLIFITLYYNSFGFHKAAMISTVIFSLVHWSSFDMETTSWFWYIGVFLIGYILVILYTYTNSIFTAICFHFSWNFLVDLMVEKENKIGIYTIIDYSQHSKTLDNIEVAILVITLFLLLNFIDKKHKAFLGQKNNYK